MEALAGSGPAFALGAAVLFGMSTPFAKIGRGRECVTARGLLYGADFGLALWRALRAT